MLKNDGTVALMNKSARNMFESKKEKDSEHFSTILFGNKLPEGVERQDLVDIHRLIGKGIEFVAKGKDDKSFNAELRITEMKLRNEVYFVAIVRDITDAKRATEALVNLVKSETLSNAKSSFVATISHEIRNPLVCSLIYQSNSDINQISKNKKIEWNFWNFSTFGKIRFERRATRACHRSSIGCRNAPANCQRYFRF